MYKLFYSPGTIALATHIILEEVGAPYEAIRLNIPEGEHTKPEYLKINPKGRIPSLITEDGILTETPAILLFLAQKFPKANLAPLDDVFRLAEMQSINSYFCSTLHINHAHRMRGHRWVDPANTSAIKAMQAKVKSNMTDCFTLVSNEMLQGPWVMGAQFTVADAYLFTVTRWMKGDGLNLADFPKIEAHHNHMTDRPAVQRALAMQAA
jgi:glutathione S-transferase